MPFPCYDSPAQAMAATDEFYWAQEGFEYPQAKVTEWLRVHLALPRQGRVLDLCCGDGIWSKGMQNLQPKLELFGIDLSEGGVCKALRLLPADNNHFLVGDTELDLPWPDGFFDLIFARGPGLYNQHSMDRPASIAIIEMWHQKLKAAGRFYSIYASDPRKMGTYTPLDEVKLPYNRCPRKTQAVDFLGGKFHHSIQSFLAPFWKASNVAVGDYRFINNQHILLTRPRAD